MRVIARSLNRVWESLMRRWWGSVTISAFFNSSNASTKSPACTHWLFFLKSTLGKRTKHVRSPSSKIAGSYVCVRMHAALSACGCTGPAGQTWPLSSRTRWMLGSTSPLRDGSLPENSCEETSPSPAHLERLLSCLRASMLHAVCHWLISALCPKQHSALFDSAPCLYVFTTQIKISLPDANN